MCASHSCVAASYHHGNHGGNAVIDHNMVIMVITMVVVLQCVKHSKNETGSFFIKAQAAASTRLYFLARLCLARFVAS